MNKLSLQISDLSVSYGNGHYSSGVNDDSSDRTNDVLRGLSVSFEQGRIHWLLGPNGAGKSTLFKAICGEIAVHRGEIRFEDRQLNNLPPSSRVRFGIGRFLQTQWVFPNLSLLDNIRVALTQQPGEKIASALLPGSWRREAEITERSIQLLRAYGFAERYDIAKTPAGALSCGWAKLLSIVRLLIQDPKLWLLDEPIANVDEANQDRICRIIAEQVKTHGRTVILIEHEVGAAGRISHLADRAVLMFQGRVVSDGLPLEVKASKSYREVFGVA